MGMWEAEIQSLQRQLKAVTEERDRLAKLVQFPPLPVGQEVAASSDWSDRLDRIEATLKALVDRLSTSTSTIASDPTAATAE